jgi:hypothetical protein
MKSKTLVKRSTGVPFPRLGAESRPASVHRASIRSGLVPTRAFARVGRTGRRIDGSKRFAVVRYPGSSRFAAGHDDCRWRFRHHESEPGTVADSPARRANPDGSNVTREHDGDLANVIRPLIELPHPGPRARIHRQLPRIWLPAT